jgi:SCY1-like protein 1
VWETIASHSKVDEVSDDLPDDFLRTKILPELLTSVEYGGGGSRVFGLVMKLSAKISEDEYEARLTPVIVRLFASPDRAIRVCLLDNLPLMIDHLPQKLVNDKIFPQMVKRGRPKNLIAQDFSLSLFPYGRC